MLSIENRADLWLVVCGLALSILLGGCQPRDKPSATDKDIAAPIIANWTAEKQGCDAKYSSNNPHCASQTQLETKLAELNWCLGEHIHDRSEGSHWAKCTEPAAIERLEREWAGYYDNCAGAVPGKATDAACAGTQRIEEKLKRQGYCYGEEAPSAAESEWKPCLKRVAIPNAGEDSVDLAAAKINLLALVREVHFVELVKQCGLRSQIWFERVVETYGDKIRAEMANENLSESEKSQLDSYVKARGDVREPCHAVASAPIMTELDGMAAR